MNNKDMKLEGVQAAIDGIIRLVAKKHSVYQEETRVLTSLLRGYTDEDGNINKEDHTAVMILDKYTQLREERTTFDEEQGLILTLLQDVRADIISDRDVGTYRLKRGLL